MHKAHKTIGSQRLLCRYISHKVSLCPKPVLPHFRPKFPIFVAQNIHILLRFFFTLRYMVHSRRNVGTTDYCVGTKLDNSFLFAFRCTNINQNQQWPSIVFICHCDGKCAWPVREFLQWTWKINICFLRMPSSVSLVTTFWYSAYNRRAVMPFFSSVLLALRLTLPAFKGFTIAHQMAVISSDIMNLSEWVWFVRVYIYIYIYI